MNDINSVILVGRLARDPEVVGGGTVCKLRLANSDRIKRGEEWADHTNWFDVTAFGKLAEHCIAYLSKGRQVAVVGKLRYREWEKDGAKRSAVEVIADAVQFIGPKDGASSSASSLEGRANAAGLDVTPASYPEDDDIPF